MHLFCLAYYCSFLAGPAVAATLKETLAGESSLSILDGLLKQFDLLDTFDSAKDITLLAPTNQAYLDLAKWGFNVSEVPAPVAKALLTYHVLDGAYDSESITSSDDVTVVHTLLRPPVLTNVTQGAAVKLSGSNGKVVTESGLQVIGGVVEPDLEFDQGFIHTINSSLVLPHNISTTAQLQGLTKFLDAMEIADMVPELEGQKDVTLFIPHNAALERIEPLFGILTAGQLAKVLAYHAIPGKVLYHSLLEDAAGEYDSLLGQKLRIQHDTSGTVHVNGAKVVREDLIIYGGVAHIVDSVLSPEKDSDELPSAAGLGAIPAQRTGGLNSFIGLWQSNVARLALGGFVVLSVMGAWLINRRSARRSQDGTHSEMKKFLPA